jgi:uncharacterized membrane protein
MDPNQSTENQEPFALDEEAAGQPQGGASPSATTENERLLSGLSYVSQIILPAVFPVVLLLSEDTRRNPFMRYHAVQSLGLLVATILFYLAAAVAYAVVAAIAPVLLCLLWMVVFVPAAAMLYYGYKAFRGEYVEVPYLTAFMRSNGWL